MIRHRIRTAAVFLAVLLSACTAIKDAVHMHNPEFTMHSVRLTGLGADSVDLAFDVDLSNPNPVPVSLEAIQYELWLEGTRFLTGRRDTRYDIRALGERSIELPLTLDYARLRQSYAALKGQDSTSYELRARLTFQIPVLGYRSLSIKRSGRLPIARPPKLDVIDIRLERLGLGGADMVLRLRVVNPNAFSLGIHRLDYDLAVNARSWTTGFMAEPVQLAPRGKQEVKVPLSVNLSRLGMDVYEGLRQGKPMEYHLRGGIDLRTGLSLLPSVRLPLDLSGTVDLGR